MTADDRLTLAEGLRAYAHDADLANRSIPADGIAAMLADDDGPFGGRETLGGRETPSAWLASAVQDCIADLQADADAWYARRPMTTTPHGYRDYRAWPDPVGRAAGAYDEPDERNTILTATATLGSIIAIYAEGLADDKFDRDQPVGVRHLTGRLLLAIVTPSILIESETIAIGRPYTEVTDADRAELVESLYGYLTRTYALPSDYGLDYAGWDTAVHLAVTIIRSV